jgi:hypothetical protein
MKRVVAYYKFCYMPSQRFHTESLAYASYTKLQQHQIQRFSRPRRMIDDEHQQQ